MKSATLTPAYGRDYKSRKAVETDFNGNKDFILVDMFSPWNGKPCNKSDLASAGYGSVSIRYGKLRKVTIVKLN